MSSHPAYPPESPRPPADLNPRTDPPLDFPDADFGELTPADYDVLGFMAGLEVHQQLFTTSKLFCRCPAGIRTTRVDAEVLRHMRPTLSELGEYDGTALMEFKTRKEIVYLLERGSVCTYEMDDTPPFMIDREAVDQALEVAQLFELNLVSELHVMRKQYLDGSIPTGFQRTTMIGLGGVIPFRASELGGDRQLRIRQLTLEEDSCREVSDHGHRITFRTDRLGMPLIETVTEPELLTPRDVQAGIELLAAVARSTGRVRRGAGAARQDVNVSVAGGRRVEIKGVPSARATPLLVHNEAFRQLNLLRIRAELRRRGVDRDLLGAGLPDDQRLHEFSLVVGSLLRKSDYAPVQGALERGDSIRVVRLPGFRHLLAHRTQPGMTFARELSGRVQVIACLCARPFMIHSDVVGYGLKGSTWQQLRAATGAESSDALVLVWGPEPDVSTAALEVLERAVDALAGVPSETRQAYADGTTGFERILPGPDRMYPDTDTPPLPIPDSWVAEVRGRLPARPWEREDALQVAGLDCKRAAWLVSRGWDHLLAASKPASPAIARRLAEALAAQLPSHLGRRGGRLPDSAPLRALAEAVASGRLVEHAIDPAVRRILAAPNRDVEAILADFEPAGPDEVEAAVAAAVAAKDQLRTNDGDAALRWAMGEAMTDLRGRVPPADVRARLLEALAIDRVRGQSEVSQ